MTSKKAAALIPIFTLALAATPQEQMQDEQRLSGPYTHDNLSIFLIHGKDRLAGRKLLTLKEALAKKKVIVHETGNVNELSIENRSGDEVFIQAGDIVKGGRQDRVLSLDVILPPKSGKIPVSAFCVEQGRWSQRQGETAAQFSSSEKALSSKKLKIAARKSADQGEVWKEVAATQSKLAENMKADVRSEKSETSLQLTLENGEVKKRTAEYLAKLLPVLDKKDDVVGYAFAINGRVNSAEVYASPALLRTLWPKLLESNVVEAIAELEGGKAGSVPAPPESDVRKLLTSKGGKRSERNVSKAIKLTTVESEDGSTMFETSDAAGVPIHQSYY